MDRDGGRTVAVRSRRRRLWALAACAGLAVSQPAVAVSHPIQPGVAAQLNPFQGVICVALQSLSGSFAQFPAAAAVLASIAEAFGCSGGTPPGTTTTTIVQGTTTSTTVAPGTTTTLIGQTTTSSTVFGGPTSSITVTTLGPCLPTTTAGTIVPTTIPCIPTG